MNAWMKWLFGGLSCRLREPMLHRIKPCQHILTMAPTRSTSVFCWRRKPLQRNPLSRDVGLSIVGGRINARVSKPATDNGDVNASSD